MHDPMTVAHDIPNPLSWYKDYNGKWKMNRLITIWHVDPEKDGSDDSCGWFMRSRHCDQAKLKKIAKEFEFNSKSGVPYGWFAENGEPNYSPQAIVVGMFLLAANIHFGHWSRRSNRFLRKHTFDILHFAENSCDSMLTFITQHYGRDKRDTVESRAQEAASIVYSWICRADRPWWRHPRWHIHHWKLQIHPIQNLKRRFWDKCYVCGKRGFKGAAIGRGWDSGEIAHSECVGHGDAACSTPKQQ